jgi:hypothetical protein
MYIMNELRWLVSEQQSKFSCNVMLSLLILLCFCRVEMTLDLRGPEHAQEIIDVLRTVYKDAPIKKVE